MRIRCVSLVCCLLASASFSAAKKAMPTVLWTAGAPCCQFQRTEDGRYHWRMNGDDLDVSLIMDSQVLPQSQHRFYRIVALYLSFAYTGPGKLEFPADLQLEFERHHKVTIPNSDPDELCQNLQNDIDTLVLDTQRAVKRDPAKADPKTARAREFEKEAAEFIDFVSTQSLQPAVLNPGSPEAHGWAFFRTDKNKWIGGWNKKEDMILRVKLKDRVLEFPFSLPPPEEDFSLRKREE